MGRAPKNLSYRVKNTFVELGSDPVRGRRTWSHDEPANFNREEVNVNFANANVAGNYNVDDNIIPSTPSPFLHPTMPSECMEVPPFGDQFFEDGLGLPPALIDANFELLPNGFEGDINNGMFMHQMMFDQSTGTYMPCFMMMDPAVGAGMDAGSGMGPPPPGEHGEDGFMIDIDGNPILPLGPEETPPLGPNGETLMQLGADGGPGSMPEGWIPDGGDGFIDMEHNGPDVLQDDPAVWQMQGGCIEESQGDWHGEGNEWGNVDGWDQNGERWEGGNGDIDGGWDQGNAEGWERGPHGEGEWTDHAGSLHAGEGEWSEHGGHTVVEGGHDGRWKESVGQQSAQDAEWVSDAAQEQPGSRGKVRDRKKERQQKQQEREQHQDWENSQGDSQDESPIERRPVAPLIPPVDAQGQPVAFTTVMLRNIPNKYTREMLVKQLNQDFRGLIDFVYLPIDFKNRCNVGYGFINFRTVESCEIFVTKFNGVDVRKCLPGLNSRKVAEVTPARVQGLDENVRRLRNSPVMNELALHPEWMPLLLDEQGEETLFPMPEQPCPPVKPRRRGRDDSDAGR